MKTFKADLTIIPGKGIKVARLTKYGKSSRFQNIENFLESELDDPNEKLVDVWVVGPDFDSFGTFTNSSGETIRFPVSLPASMLAGKREGDQLVIENEHGRFELTCHQRKCWYRYYNTFEDVYNYVIS